MVIFLRYPKGKEHITGYDYEPWHFRYIGVKMATAVYESGLTYDEFHAMFIEPILRKDPKTSELSSDDFYNLTWRRFLISMRLLKLKRN